MFVVSHFSGVAAGLSGTATPETTTTSELLLVSRTADTAEGADYKLRHRALWMGALPGLVAMQPEEFPEHHHQGVNRSWLRGPLEINLKLSDQSPWVADRIQVELRVLGPADTEVQFPDLAPVSATLELSGTHRWGPLVQSDGRQLWQLSFSLEANQAGSYELPPLQWRYRNAREDPWHTAMTDPIAIEFRSMLGDDPDQASLQPNPEPAGWPLDWPLIATVLAALLLAVGFGAVYLVRRRNRAPAPVLISAYQKAMDAVNRIDQSELLKKMEMDRFYTELSSVIRHYVEDRFAIRAPEQTTEEFLCELRNNSVLNRTQGEALARFLEQCDLVKFARLRPSTVDGRKALEAARDFVQTTRDDSVLVRVV